MGRKEDIDIELEKLHVELDNVHGGPTEVMQRITGYYRNTKYFNLGKVEELKERKKYKVPAYERTD